MTRYRKRKRFHHPWDNITSFSASILARNDFIFLDPAIFAHPPPPTLPPLSRSLDIQSPQISFQDLDLNGSSSESGASPDISEISSHLTDEDDNEFDDFDLHNEDEDDEHEVFQLHFPLPGDPDPDANAYPDAPTESHLLIHNWLILWGIYLSSGPRSFRCVQYTFIGQL